MNEGNGKWPSGGGAMGALMRSKDWTATPLGNPDGWPKSLRTMLGVVLENRFPMMIWWGPDLINFYNDAYRPILREKHPESLAQSTAQLWAEIWDFADPLARGVLAGGPATWMEDVQRFIKSGSLSEETYFTFSYSPIPGDDGLVGGLLNTVQETTIKVQSESQIRMLHELATCASGAQTVDAALLHAAIVLGTNELDLPLFSFCRVRDDDHARLIAEARWKDYKGPARAERISLDNGWPIREALRSRHEIVVEDVAERFGALPDS